MLFPVVNHTLKFVTGIFSAILLIILRYLQIWNM